MQDCRREGFIFKSEGPNCPAPGATSVAGDGSSTSYVRVNTAVQIADRIKAKTGLQPQPHQHVDDFLEEAAKKIRDSGQFR